jgi:hypothetical protein
MYAPYQALDLIRSRNNVRSLMFGDYNYTEQYVAIDGNSWVSIFNPIKIEESYDNMELCVRSRVGGMHIPMIDFVGRDLDSIRSFVNGFCMPYFIFDSGNSYHYYGCDLYNQREWLGFIGELLLNKDQIVDVRWIGHSLKSGHTSLRLSHNFKTEIKFVEYGDEFPF